MQRKRLRGIFDRVVLPLMSVKGHEGQSNFVTLTKAGNIDPVAMRHCCKFKFRFSVLAPTSAAQKFFLAVFGNHMKRKATRPAALKQPIGISSRWARFHSFVETRMIINAATAAVATKNAAFIYSASTPGNRSYYLPDDKNAQVLRTGQCSVDFHEVAGPKQFRVAHCVGNKYTGPENDFHTDDQNEAIAHADHYVGKKLS